MGSSRFGEHHQSIDDRTARRRSSPPVGVVPHWQAAEHGCQGDVTTLSEVSSWVPAKVPSVSGMASAAKHQHPGQLAHGFEPLGPLSLAISDICDVVGGVDNALGRQTLRKSHGRGAYGYGRRWPLTRISSGSSTARVSARCVRPPSLVTRATRIRACEERMCPSNVCRLLYGSTLLGLSMIIGPDLSVPERPGIVAYLSWRWRCCPTGRRARRGGGRRAGFHCDPASCGCRGGTH